MSEQWSVSTLLQALGEEGSILKQQLPASIGDLTISGLSSDSRYLQSGDLFFALNGAAAHGLNYVEQLIDGGAALILYEEAGAPTTALTRLREVGVPTFACPNIATLLPKFAKQFYRQRLKSLTLLATTGTEGKTSVTQFIAQALRLLDESCGLIGTNGIGFLGALAENTHTTPDLLALYRSLAEIEHDFPDQPRKPVALEATSHALDQERIAGLSFQSTLFTNLTRDHLDYHKTLRAYGAAKRALFFDYKSKASIINSDDPFGAELLAELAAKEPERILYPYGERAEGENALQMSNLTLTAKGLQFTLNYQGASYQIESPLYGGFNAYNLLAMVGTLCSLGYAIDEIVAIIPKINHVRGRMEMVPLANGAVGVVDYAHKPNALKEALRSLRAHIGEGSLRVLFGCGGDRDRGKRPIMGRIAEEEADFITITSDNPRHESPEAIIQEIIEGLDDPQAKKVTTILDRREAIAATLAQSEAGDIILIAGKGHEDYQIIGDQVIHFSDIEELERFNRTIESR